MFKKFSKDEEGSIFEYVILLAAMSICIAMFAPQIKDFSVDIFNKSIENINNALSGGESETPETPEIPGIPEIPENDFTPPDTEKPTQYTQIIKLDVPTPRVNYQVKVVLNKDNFDYSKVANDGSDLAFKDMSGTTMNRYIENWNPNGESVIWVKIPFPGTEEFTFSYGSGAKIENNPAKVFDLYEDFSTYDTSTWQGSTDVGEGEVYVKDGILNIDEGGISKKLDFDPAEGYYFEVKGKVKEDRAGYSGVFAGLSTNQFVSSGNWEKDATVLLMRLRNIESNRWSYFIGDGDVSRSSNYAYEGQTDIMLNNNQWYTTSYKVLPNKVITFIDGKQKGEFPLSWVQNLNYLILGAYTGIEIGGGWEFDSSEYDYLLVRKASEVEPVATVEEVPIQNQ